MRSPLIYGLFAGLVTPTLVVTSVIGQEDNDNIAKEVPIHFVDCSIENGSPLWWSADPEGTIRIHLIYDQERSSPNRANGHWLFRIEADPNTEVTLKLGPFANVWNRQFSRPDPEAKVCFLSDDGRNWRPVRTESDEPFWVRLQVHLQGPSLYVARLHPYGLADLDQLIANIKSHSLVEVTTIGRSVEGRSLPSIRIGRPTAPHVVLLRAPIPGRPAATG